MKKCNGRPKFDSVFIGEVQLDLLNYPEHFALVVKVGFADSTAQRRLGHMTRVGGWSEETKEAMARFVEALERDAAVDLFDGEDATGSGVIPYDSTTGRPPSL